MDLGGETIGRRLARLRKEHGLTQVELADAIGILQTLVTDYECDQLRLNTLKFPGIPNGDLVQIISSSAACAV